MRLGVSVLLVVVAAACGGGLSGLFRQYEYEEELYLSLDGTATLYVNSSIPALNALRGTTFDEREDTRVDREAIAAYFTSPVTEVTRVTESRRNNRRYVHVRMDVSDVRRLAQAPPFAWSRYEFAQEGEAFVFRQRLGGAARTPRADGAAPPWMQSELVAFRIHAPSEITYHNAGAANQRRGNILVWEQGLVERLRGVPLSAEAHMETQSILYTTLILFASTAIAVALTFAGILWWLTRRRTSN